MKNFVEQVDDVRYKIKIGAVPNMKTEGMFYVNDDLKGLVFDELEKSAAHGTAGTFVYSFWSCL